MGVYIIHFLQPYKHAAHYTGFSPEVQARVNAHLHGKGARLTQVAHEAGCTMVLVKVWEEGDRTLERKLKNASHIRRYCPICKGLGVQLPLLAGEPAYVPSQEAQEPAPLTPLAVDDSQLDLWAWVGLEEYLDEQEARLDAQEWVQDVGR